MKTETCGGYTSITEIDGDLRIKIPLSGKRLFQDVSKTSLKLVETKGFPSGVVLLEYQRVGKGDGK